jgi:hypothetical protein
MIRNYITDEKTYAKKKKKTVYRLPAGAAVCGFVVKVFRVDYAIRW